MLPWPLFTFGVIAAALFDVRARVVPNALTVALAVAGALAQALASGWSGLGSAVLGAAVGLGLLLVPFGARWLGGGDVKLAAALGAWVGPLGALQIVVLGLVLGGLLSLVVLAGGSRSTRTEVARNLWSALLWRSVAQVSVRPRAEVVPLAVAFGAAGLWTFFGGGPLHA